MGVEAESKTIRRRYASRRQRARLPTQVELGSNAERGHEANGWQASTREERVRDEL